MRAYSQFVEVDGMCSTAAVEKEDFVVVGAMRFIDVLAGVYGMGFTNRHAFWI